MTPSSSFPCLVPVKVVRVCHRDWIFWGLRLQGVQDVVLHGGVAVLLQHGVELCVENSLLYSPQPLLLTDRMKVKFKRGFPSILCAAPPNCAAEIPWYSAQGNAFLKVSKLRAEISRGSSSSEFFGVFRLPEFFRGFIPPGRFPPFPCIAGCTAASVQGCHS